MTTATDPTPAALPADWHNHYLERVAIMAENGPVTPEIEAVALADTLDAIRRDGGKDES